MSEPGFWVFSPPLGKGVHTQINNLRVHTTGSDTRTTSIGTTVLSHNIVFICGDINALGWDPRVGKFRIMATKQSVRVGWSGITTGVRRSRVPLVTLISQVRLG
jgi:hypothetical protein